MKRAHSQDNCLYDRMNKKTTTLKRESKSQENIPKKFPKLYDCPKCVGLRIVDQFKKYQCLRHQKYRINLLNKNIRKIL